MYDVTILYKKPLSLNLKFKEIVIPDSGFKPAVGCGNRLGIAVGNMTTAFPRYGIYHSHIDTSSLLNSNFTGISFRYKEDWKGH